MPARSPEPPLDAEGLARVVPVSRETLGRLAAYLEELCRWQRAINLIAASTLADPWRRHVLDSAQLVRFLPEKARTLVDLGSGAGLPGLVLAILGVPDVRLIESDRRKAVFLRETARRLGLPVTVHPERVEAVAPFTADVVTARALAPLDRLLPLAARFVEPRTRCLFLKGAGLDAELTEARKAWMMRTAVHPSLSAPDGRVVVLDEVQRAHGAGPIAAQP